MSDDIHCPACEGRCQIYTGEAPKDVPGAVPGREIPHEDADTVCARCRRRIPACEAAGECGRERAS